MALCKTVTYQGQEASYWKIHKVDLNTLYNQMVIRMALYKDKAARDADKDNYLKLDNFSIDGVEFNAPVVYQQLKAMSVFDGATDC
jgi:hypothetical protein